jgi:hypothetical protein
MRVSFGRDILPMFRPIDIEHMSKHNILLDDHTYMLSATLTLGLLQVCRHLGAIPPKPLM